MELVGKVRDRSICTPELLQHTASGGVGERRERDIESAAGILNHTVQYTPHSAANANGCAPSPEAVEGRLATAWISNNQRSRLLAREQASRLRERALRYEAPYLATMLTQVREVDLQELLKRLASVRVVGTAGLRKIVVGHR